MKKSKWNYQSQYLDSCIKCHEKIHDSDDVIKVLIRNVIYEIKAKEQYPTTKIMNKEFNPRYEYHVQHESLWKKWYFSYKIESKMLYVKNFILKIPDQTNFSEQKVDIFQCVI